MPVSPEGELAVADTRGPRLPVTTRAELSRDGVESYTSIYSSNDGIWESGWSHWKCCSEPHDVPSSACPSPQQVADIHGWEQKV